MGLLSKLFKGLKKVVRKIGGGIKRLVKKVGGVFGKMGILGHIGMMFLMPYAQSFWGSLGTFGTQLATGTSVAGKAFGNIMRGVYHAGKSVGTVYRTVTSAVEGSLKWLSNKVGLTDIANPFSGLDKVVQDAQNWGAEGWTGKLPVDTPISDKLKASLAKPPTIEEMTEGFEYKPETPDYMKDALGMNDPMNQPLIKQDTIFEQTIGGMDSNVDLITGDKITPAIDSSSLMVPSGTTKVPFGQKIKEGLTDYGTEFWEKTKQELSPSGIADNITEGMTAGLKQKGAELIVGEPPDPIYKSVKIDFGDTSLTNTPILDDLAISKFDSKGFSFGSHKMNNHYSNLIGMGYDEYLDYIGKAAPSSFSGNYRLDNQAGY